MASCPRAPHVSEASVSGKQIAYTAVVSLLVVLAYERYSHKG